MSGRRAGIIELDHGLHIFFDTNILIYALEENERFPEAVEFFKLKSGQILHTSALTLMEYSVPAYRSERHDLIVAATSFLRAAHVRIHPINERIVLKAASLRAASKLKPLDALQLATALTCHADSFVTAVKDFPNREDISVYRLNENY